jgi:hypothetical protein
MNYVIPWRGRRGTSEGSGRRPALGRVLHLSPARGPCVGQIRGSPMGSGLASRLTESWVNYQNPGASGSVNRSSRPDSVRYMSVTTAAQRRLLTDDDTR